jgi:hypothetical protein
VSSPRALAAKLLFFSCRAMILDSMLFSMMRRVTLMGRSVRTKRRSALMVEGAQDLTLTLSDSVRPIHRLEL